MTKKEFINKFNALLDGNQTSQQLVSNEIKAIKQKLDCISDDYAFNLFPSVNTYFCSRIAPMESLSTIICAINKDFSEYIKDNIEQYERKAGGILDSRKKIGMVVFLFFIILLAIAAVGCMVFSFFIEEDPELINLFDKIGDAFGTLDFTLGAIGFVWERISDMKNDSKKSDLHIKSEDVKKSTNYESIVESTNEFAKEYKKCITFFQIGFVNIANIKE